MERPLQAIDRLRYNPTTSDDPVIQQVSLIRNFFHNNTTETCPRSLRPIMLLEFMPRMLS